MSLISCFTYVIWTDSHRKSFTHWLHLAYICAKPTTTYVCYHGDCIGIVCRTRKIVAMGQNCYEVIEQLFSTRVLSLDYWQSDNTWEIWHDGHQLFDKYIHTCWHYWPACTVWLYTPINFLYIHALPIFCAYSLFHTPCLAHTQSLSTLTGPREVPDCRGQET